MFSYEHYLTKQMVSWETVSMRDGLQAQAFFINYKKNNYNNNSNQQLQLVLLS